MSEISQKTIESFFQEYGVKNADKKASILPLLTDIVYDYNLAVVKYEKEQDNFKKKQILVEIKETEDKIKEIFEEELDK